MWDCQLNSLGLYFWLHSPIYTLNCSYEGFEKDQSHPALLVYDVIAIRIIIEGLNVHIKTQQVHHSYIEFKRKYVLQRFHCEYAWL